jgi:lipoprotein-anchoring transpeptidase ErfK/SrfK
MGAAAAQTGNDLAGRTGTVQLTRLFAAAIAFLLAWMAFTTQPVGAQPLTSEPVVARSVAAEQANGITSPAGGAEVSGTVSVEGVAVHPTFRKWQLDLLIDGDERQAHFLAVGEEPVSPAGLLTTFDSTLYHNGSHTLRLRVVYFGLNYDEYFTPIRIANSGAPAPAPEDSANAGADDSAADDSAADDSAAEGDAEKPAEPAPVSFRIDAPTDGKKWIEIDISDQRLVAWQGDVPVFETIVSTGKPGWRTLPGVFNVYRKYEETRMRGADYDTPDVPWTMYYSGGFAIHGAYWHNNFGTPVSHGCVNLRVPEAKALYEWAPMGTEVVVNQ